MSCSIYALYLISRPVPYTQTDFQIRKLPGCIPGLAGQRLRIKLFSARLIARAKIRVWVRLNDTNFPCKNANFHSTFDLPVPEYGMTASFSGNRLAYGIQHIGQRRKGTHVYTHILQVTNELYYDKARHCHFVEHQSSPKLHWFAAIAHDKRMNETPGNREE